MMRYGQRYGYPFARIEQALKACESVDGIEITPITLHELIILVNDYSASFRISFHGHSAAAAGNGVFLE